MGQIRGVFFDLDDTLIAYGEAERAAIQEAELYACQRYPQLADGQLAYAVLAQYDSRFCYGTSGFVRLGEIPTLELRRELTLGALAAFGIDDATLIDELVALYSAAEERLLTAYPDTIATLDRLRHYFRMGLITNGPSRLQREKLTHCGIDHYFSPVVIDTEVGWTKPDRRIFDLAAQRAGLDSTELVFIGNAPDADIVGAHRAGWTTIYLQRQETEAPEADYTIHHLEELFSLPIFQNLDKVRTPNR